ncbi:MAG: S9 family peptidase [Gemmatimonadota bacterium]|nr:MAG: S9 family peptidase [Gemmatimonadota bacterium]
MAAKSTPKTAPLIPREILFGNPVRASPQISPDGTKMAYLAPVNGVLNVWVGNVGREDYRPVTHDTDRGVRVYFWAHDGRHIMYLQDVAGDENWRLFSVDLITGSEADLTPFENVQVQIVHHDKHHPNDLVIAMNKEDVTVHDVYRLDLVTKELELAARNPGNVANWVVDSALAVRGAVAATDDGGFDLLVRDATNADWRTLVSWDTDDALTSGPIGFTRDGKSMYLLDSRGANAAPLVRIDVDTGDLEELARDEQYDVGDVLVHPDTYEVQMVSFVRSRIEHYVLDHSIEADVEAIKQLNPGDFGIYNRTHDDRTWLVGFTEDSKPFSYYVFDRETQKGTFLFYARPELAEYELARMEPISLESRDGYTIHGYIHLPVGSTRQNLPTVLLVHGGPWHRDTWGYDPEGQWLANRGYAVLQVNFRGSTGFGKEFLNAGDREWGGKMHDDLVDAVRWIIAQGIADPDRIAVYGGSYGGYAALVGATFTPDLFACAVDVVGPSNLITFIETIPPYWSAYRAILQRRVGDPATDGEFLRSRSPLFHAENIKIPILIAQGANDPRVKQSESEQIVAVMEEKGIDHEYLLFPDEGHGFAKPENRIGFYTAAERFLAQHLGGRVE